MQRLAFQKVGTPGALPLKRGRAAAVIPPWALNVLVIEGDSISNTLPGDSSNDFRGNYYIAQNPGITGYNRAQGSRNVGYTAEGDVLNDNGNSLLGNVAEDMAYNPDLLAVTPMLANDIANTRSATTAVNALINYRNEVRAARPSCRVLVGLPLPYNPDGSHPTYANFTANRAALFALNPRNPAFWGQFADYYSPEGENPDFITIGSSLYADTVHPTKPATNPATGQGRLYTQFKAIIDSIAGIADVENMWPDSETGLALNTTITRDFIIQGIDPYGVTGGVSCSGANSTVSINGAAPSSDTTDRTAWLYNGDIIRMTADTSTLASTPVTVNLTIAGVTRAITYTTTAAVAPVVLSNAGTKQSGPSSTSINLTNLTFADGAAVVALTCWSTAGGSVDSVPTSLTLTPVGGGAAITLVRRQFGGRAVSRSFAVYTATVTAGTYDLTGTRPNAARVTYASYFTLENADPVPVAAPAFTSVSSEADPHLATSVTVPANGIGIGWLMKENATVGTAGPGSTLINTGEVTDTGSTAGFVAVQRATTGQPAMNSGFGTFGRGAMAFKALGS